MKPTHPTLSLSTVYKTLQTLAQRRVVQTIECGTGKQRFDGQPGPHHHAVCCHCGRIVDVEFQKLPVSLPKGRFVPDFTIESVKVYFAGICEKCQVS